MADIDKDGFLEIVVGSYGEGINQFYVWNHDGSYLDNWPQEVEYDIHASPALGDIDRDRDIEIIIADMGNIYVFEKDGTVKNGWPQGNFSSWVESSPALADVNNDGLLEIFLTAGDSYGWSYNGEILLNWPVNNHSYETTIGDIDGDYQAEILNISIYPEKNVYALNSDGSAAGNFPLELAAPPSNSPAVSDLDKDGKTDIVFGSYSGSVYVFDTGSAYYKRYQDWPMQNHNLKHTGFYKTRIIDKPIKKER